MSVRFGDGSEGMLVQAMADQGVEVSCGAVQDEVFGAVMIFEAGGIDTREVVLRPSRLVADQPSPDVRRLR
nr:acetate--CoA ligase family protein [Actinomadura sp. NAK00032]